MNIPDWLWHLFQCIGAVGTIVAALVAWLQIGNLRKQQCGWKSLEVCERYETDAILDTALRRIRAASLLPWHRRKIWEVRTDITTVLNYLDGIAVGVQQGFYDEKIVRAHLEPVIRAHVEEYFSGGLPEKYGYEPTAWCELAWLLERWDSQPTSLKRLILEMAS